MNGSPSQRTGRARVRVLKLTPECRESAQKVVPAFDAFDRDETKLADCDFLHVEFQSREQRDLAAHSFLRLASHDQHISINLHTQLLQTVHTITDLQVSSTRTSPTSASPHRHPVVPTSDGSEPEIDPLAYAKELLEDIRSCRNELFDISPISSPVRLSRLASKVNKFLNADLMRIAEEGLKWAVPQRDAHRRSEKKEEIDGWV